MNFKVLYNPEVYNDIIQAVEWYNNQKEGLGTRFLTVTKKQFQTLKRSALHYAIRYDDIRCMPIKHFPYSQGKSPNAIPRDTVAHATEWQLMSARRQRLG